MTPRMRSGARTACNCAAASLLKQGAPMKKHIAGSSTAAILRDARLRRALRMRDEYAATSTQMDAAEAHPEEAAKQSSRRTRRSLRHR
jgi:hypothetical protein